MVTHAIGSAIALLVLALLILGTSWGGQVTADGTWIDGVSLRQWAVYLVAVAIVGVVVGPRVRSIRDRGLALAPTLVWLGVALWGPLGPIPLLVYLVPTTAVWLVSLEVGARLRPGLARSVKS